MTEQSTNVFDERQGIYVFDGRLKKPIIRYVCAFLRASRTHEISFRYPPDLRGYARSLGILRQDDWKVNQN